VISVLAEFEVSTFSNYRDMKEDPKCKNSGDPGWLGSLEVIGNVTVAVIFGHRRCLMSRSPCVSVRLSIVEQVWRRLERWTLSWRNRLSSTHRNWKMWVVCDFFCESVLGDRYK